MIFLVKDLKQKVKIDLNNKDIKDISGVVVPDTSIIVHGVISKEILSGALKFKKIVIHEAVIAELESQANKGRDSGFLGLDEISSIRELSSGYGFVLEFSGSRPNDFEIKFAKSGEIDSLIRSLAGDIGATLLTADVVQGKVALAKGINVFIYDVPVRDVLLRIEDFFVDGAMSVHLREGLKPKAKIGRPGSWVLKEIGDEVLSKDFLESLYLELVDFARGDESSFFESDKKHSTIFQVKDMRVVVVRRPLSDAFEITAVRPVSRLSLKDYNLSDSFLKRLFSRAEGLLVAGPPGHGKSTFIQSLADEYVSLNKIVKTLESPRDLVVDKSITRYGSNQASSQDIRDILLLSRPDFVLFDEVRNVEDFKLFSDLRLSGIGMLGVIHASEPIDAVQRFIGRLDLGVIPHVLDTVVFIKDGLVAKVFSISLSVKVPSGMVEADLARPIVLINDFFSGRLEFEVYSFGEEAIVVPVSSFSNKRPIYSLAEKVITDEIKNIGISDVCVDFLSDNKCVVFVSKDDVPKLIGPKGSVISGFQKKFNLKIDVLEKKASKKQSDTLLNFSSSISSKFVLFDLDKDFSDVLVSLFIDDVFVMNVKSSKKAQIKISITSPSGSLIRDALNEKKEIKIFLA